MTLQENELFKAENPFHRHDLFRISAESLPESNESRLSCRTVQIAVAINHLSK